MKTLSFLTALLMGLGTALGQGTFVFDQQSSDENQLREGAVPLGGANSYPIQSFTPTLNSVGFVRLYFQGLQAVDVTVNLRADGPNGPVLGASSPVTTSTSYYGPVDFFFSTPISVTPQTVYFFETTLGSGGGQLNGSLFYNYPGGVLYFSDGTSNPNYDLWFREGVVVPEPSAAALILLAVGLGLTRKKARA